MCVVNTDRRHFFGTDARVHVLVLVGQKPGCGLMCVMAKRFAVCSQIGLHGNERLNLLKYEIRADLTQVETDIRDHV